MADDDVVICYAKRTAIGAFGKSLVPYNTSKLLSFVIKDCIETTGIDPHIISDIKSGCCLEPQEEMNIARVAALLAGIPYEVPAMTINRVCISGMEAIRAAMCDLLAGQSTLVLAGGSESMSNCAYYIPSARYGARLGNAEMKCGIMEGLHAGSKVFGEGYIMGMTAEYIAEKYGITRQMQDEAALRSQNNAEKANTSGRFNDEILPIEVKAGRNTYVFKNDEHFRPGQTIEALAKLPPAFKKDGTVTAGNSSGINDGACMTLVTTYGKAQELGLTPLAKINVKSFAKIGNDPKYMGLGPMYSTPLALKQAGMEYKDLDLVECNEAFAAQYCAVAQELKWDIDKTNVNGSGIGLGHPVGCTGARIIVTLIHEMKKRGVSYGLATLCGGGGVSEAVIIENI